MYTCIYVRQRILNALTKMSRAALLRTSDILLLLWIFIKDAWTLLLSPKRPFFGDAVPSEAKRFSTEGIGAEVEVLPKGVSILVAAVECITVTAYATVAFNEGLTARAVATICCNMGHPAS